MTYRKMTKIITSKLITLENTSANVSYDSPGPDTSTNTDMFKCH